MKKGGRTGPNPVTLSNRVCDQADVLQNELVADLRRLECNTRDRARAEIRKEADPSLKKDSFEHYLRELCSGVHQFVRNSLLRHLEIALWLPNAKVSDASKWAERKVATAFVKAFSPENWGFCYKKNGKRVDLTDDFSSDEVKEVESAFPALPDEEVYGPWYRDLSTVRDWVRWVCDDPRNSLAAWLGWQPPTWLWPDEPEDPTKPGRVSPGGTEKVWNWVASEVATAVENAKFDFAQHIKARPNRSNGPKMYEKLPQKKTSDLIRRAVLTPRQRDVARLAWDYGLPDAEIARRLGIDRKTVREHRRRATAAINLTVGRHKGSRSHHASRPSDVPEDE